LDCFFGECPLCENPDCFLDCLFDGDCPLCGDPDCDLFCLFGDLFCLVCENFKNDCICSPGTSKPPTTPKNPKPSIGNGLILGNSSPGIGDALEIFKFLAGMNNVIDEGGKGSRAWNASLITGGSTPGIADALEIFKLLAEMDSILE